MRAKPERIAVTIRPETATTARARKITAAETVILPITSGLIKLTAPDQNCENPERQPEPAQIYPWGNRSPECSQSQTHERKDQEN